MQTDILPDSRARSRVGAIQRAGAWWIPIYCANCGAAGGQVPEENMTFAFWLCAPCGEQHGAIAGTLSMPDEVFWQRVREEQLEAHGRLLSPQELIAVVDADSSPLATLLKQGCS